MKYGMMLVGFIVSAVLMNGVLTCDDFKWWMVFILVACVIDFIITIRTVVKKVRHGEW